MLCPIFQLTKTQAKLTTAEQQAGPSASPISVHISGMSPAAPRPPAPTFGGPPRFGGPGGGPPRPPMQPIPQRPPPELLEKIKDLQLQLNQANGRIKGGDIIRNVA